MTATSIALYVHIPFCKSKCVYCDFNTFAGIEHLIPSIADALITEIGAWGVTLNCPSVKSVFWGGGTPSYIPIAQLERIWQSILKAFAVDETAEITIEVNPDDVTSANARVWKALGFNRVSMGVQALDDALLKQMSRRHSVNQAQQAFKILQKCGFENLSFDLIYGWPSQTLEQWETTLKRALEWMPQHISLYSLQVEPKTPLNALVSSGKMASPNDDLMADMYILADDLLEKHNLPNYEISNWAKPSYECRHNLVYWQNGAYIGIGPGAHSSVGGQRFANSKSLHTYIDKVASVSKYQQNLETMLSNPLIQTRELITDNERIAETVILGLRLKRGIAFAEFKHQFNQDLLSLYATQINYFVELGLLETNATHLTLTKRGRLLSNEVFVQFMPTTTKPAHS